MESKLLQLLRHEGSDLKTEFEKASIKGRGTPQEVSEFRENYFKNFIARYFPFPHRIAKGNVVDTNGNESASIDCLIINPKHPYTIDTNEKFSVIFADGVDVAIEVKPDISVIDELHRGLKQIQSLKKLTRQDSPILAPSKVKMPKHIVEHSKKIPAFIFSLRAKHDPLLTGLDIIRYYKEHGIPLEEQVDYVVINEVGIISNYKYPELTKAADKSTGLFFEHWGGHTIAAFLLYLNRVYPASATLSAAVIPKYIQQIKPERFEKILLNSIDDVSGIEK